MRLPDRPQWNPNVDQYDGADDLSVPLPIILSPVRGKPHRFLSVPNIPFATVNQASFGLNEKKQVSKLNRDARLPDFDITVNLNFNFHEDLCS